MARRKKFNLRKLRKNPLLPTRFEMNPEVAREITAVVLIALGGVLFLSVVGLGGVLGFWINYVLALAFGLGKFVFVLALILLGCFLFIPKKMRVQSLSVFGALLFLAAFSALAASFGGTISTYEESLQGNFGGTLGWWLHSNSISLLGFWGATLLETAGIICGFLMFLNKSLVSLMGFLKPIFSIRFNLPSRKDQDDEEDEAIPQIRTSSIPADEPPLAKPSAKEKGFVFKPVIDANYTPPSLELLESESGSPDAGDIRKNMEIIQKTLATFNVPVTMQDVFVGPTVTQYTLKPEEGVKLQAITGLANDLSLALAAHPLRIEAPIPGKSLVGVEIPNKKFALVRMKNILSSEAFLDKKKQIPLALGLDVAGNPAAADLASMPHILIAGATGSGKSVCINAFLLSMLYRHSPMTLRLILVDPKRVELSGYNDIPHLLTPVIHEPTETIKALSWLVSEMQRRYERLQEAGVRNIAAYNAGAKIEEIMPYIVLVIDEMADLMAVSAKEVEGYIVRLAQMSRAVGIHLILSTQRPSVDVVTGLIKANIATRVCFNVASQIDSRTILDMAGAEKLLGKGDMFYLSQDSNKPRRIQGVLAVDKEVRAVVDFLRNQSEPAYLEEILQKPGFLTGSGEFSGEEAPDPLYGEAKELVMRTGKASASLLQRRLSVGYARAARLLDLMEERGVIGPGEGAKPREVLLKAEGVWE